MQKSKKKSNLYTHVQGFFFLCGPTSLSTWTLDFYGSALNVFTCLTFFCEPKPYCHLNL